VRTVLEEVAAIVGKNSPSNPPAVYRLPPAFFSGSGRRAA
jgi:hypothetical protein